VAGSRTNVAGRGKGRGTSVTTVQATISDYDPQSHDGAVLLDDGVRLPFASQALVGTRLRLLRRGQRVEVTVEDDVVRSLQILTLH
jgi:hypothetical protein